MSDTDPAQIADLVARLRAVAAAAATLLEDAEIVSKDGRMVDRASAERLEERLDALGFDPREVIDDAAE